MRAYRQLLLLPLFLFVPSSDASTFPNYLATLPKGEIVSAIPTLSDPEQNYELYLPSSFTPTKRWPLLFLFDPRSRGKVAAELFRPAAEELGWILVSSNNTRSDGPAEPNARALNATIPDAIKRLPIDEKRIYAGGFSGGGVLAWTAGLKGKYLAGVISIGGRPAPEHAALTPDFALFSAAGLRDFNYQATRELDAIAAKAGVPHRLEYFPGPHAWCPPETARRAVGWLEVLAMRDGRAPRDAALVARELAADIAAAEAIAATGDLLTAGRRFQEIVETYRGIGDPLEVQRAAARATEHLASPSAKVALKEEKAAEKFEYQGYRKTAEAMAMARAEIIPPSARLRQTVGLEDAKRRVAQGGEMGRAAERHLESVATHLGFYFVQEAFGAGDYRRALPALVVAVDARPDDPFLTYNLACAQARSGAVEEALASLTRSVDLGLPQPEQIATDADLESLRARPEFKSLLDRIRSAAPRPQ